MVKPNDTQRWFGWGSLQAPMATSIGMDALVTSFGYNLYVPYRLITREACRNSLCQQATDQSIKWCAAQPPWAM